VIVTTGLEPNQETLRHARQLAERFGLPLVERGDASLVSLRQRHGCEHLLVVTAKGASIQSAQEKPLFFHPNTAALRIKRLERGDTDIMLSVCQIQPGDTVLDATLGLGADAIVFAYAVGERGRVIGVESERLIALLVEDGLQTWQSDSPGLQQAMRRIEVLNRSHLDVLREMPDRSVDVVYFDPMFERMVMASSGIQGLRPFANDAALTEESVSEALRVARKRVVLKEGKSGRLHERFGLIPYRTRQHQVVYSYREALGGE